MARGRGGRGHERGVQARREREGVVEKGKVFGGDGAVGGGGAVGAGGVGGGGGRGGIGRVGEGD